MTKRLKIVLTNDDGIEAPGMSYLVSALLDANIADIHIVAPQTEQSGQSMAISMHRVCCLTPYPYPQNVKEAWAVGGTPVDSVKLALRALFSDSPPDLVISGINCGNNCGRSAWYSGTVGAAKQALLDNIPAIALSQDNNISFFQEKKTPEILKKLILYLLSQPFPCLTGLNINFPASPGGSSWKGMRLVAPGEEVFYEELQYMGCVNQKKYYIGKSPIFKIFGTPSEEMSALLENYISVAPLFSQNSPFGLMSEFEFQKAREDFDTFITDSEAINELF
ncbi:5'/3'-nucleotidase SurE [Candidatus Chlamydia sanziniae]|uniref:5'-nucleotidase SurE n=1 Tax=Candidatus Chlamydia sanziniae TaxID=1806891 RepID=A0A1A9HVI9_9CHLA|nr:5'/3'-nucleotidase SurE [Candidatus Chlamydia sanziniae]ANH79009.1 5-nucleotidase SurE [Candidatus Chlamydia sanziniae]